jgi:hypothetical protein
MRSAVGAPADWRSPDPATGIQAPEGSRRSRATSMSVGVPPGGEVHDRANVIGLPAARTNVHASPFGQSRSASPSTSAHGPDQWSCA